jgi:hypothetical protein
MPFTMRCYIGIEGESVTRLFTQKSFVKICPDTGEFVVSETGEGRF